MTVIQNNNYRHLYYFSFFVVSALSFKICKIFSKIKKENQYLKDRVIFLEKECLNSKRENEYLINKTHLLQNRLNNEEDLNRLLA